MENSVRDAGARKLEALPAMMEDTYENRPRDVLRSIQPIQSISDLSRRNIVENDWD